MCWPVEKTRKSTADMLLPCWGLWPSRCHLPDMAFDEHMPASDTWPWWTLFCWDWKSWKGSNLKTHSKQNLAVANCEKVKRRPVLLDYLIKLFKRETVVMHKWKQWVTRHPGIYITNTTPQSKTFYVHRNQFKGKEKGQIYKLKRSSETIQTPFADPSL